MTRAYRLASIISLILFALPQLEASTLCGRPISEKPELAENFDEVIEFTIEDVLGIQHKVQVDVIAEDEGNRILSSVRRNLTEQRLVCFQTHQARALSLLEPSDSYLKSLGKMGLESPPPAAAKPSKDVILR